MRPARSHFFSTENTVEGATPNSRTSPTPNCGSATSASAILAVPSRSRGVRTGLVSDAVAERGDLRLLAMLESSGHGLPTQSTDFNSRGAHFTGGDVRL